ncbi:alpha/beta fold hydrolase [Brooklawnia sp.]|uniref:alpha/beta hydrolase family protein n=1 Tax=Brooklawnia sp. TaxID=2699740 RepID=UPI00311F80DF
MTTTRDELNVGYGPDPAQVYDVRLPAAQMQSMGRRLPTVVVIHGGFWRGIWDRSHAAGQAQRFADTGHPTAVMEYRRMGMPGGGYPGTLEDLRAGLAAIIADPRFPEPRVLVGHSAGGQLALYALETCDGVAGAVVLGGCVDLGLAVERNLGNGAALDFLGGGPVQLPERYADADPAARLPSAGRVVLIHGIEDDEVPLAISESYLAKAIAAGSQVSLVRLPGVGHYELIDPDDAAFEPVLAAVDGFGDLECRRVAED